MSLTIVDRGDEDEAGADLGTVAVPEVGPDLILDQNGGGPGLTTETEIGEKIKNMTGKRNEKGRKKAFLQSGKIICQVID